jgi:adenosylmethionine-8-amino-7-oxononanoate aminotransferase
MKAHREVPLIPVARAQGPWLFDPDGRRYFDAISSWWVNLFGHGNPSLREAILRQFDRVDHVMLAGFTHEPAVMLAERLAGLTGDRLGHAFFASDGASATEIALKMSAHFWRNAGRPEKSEFVCAAGGYHGETLGALGVTDVPLFRSAYANLIRPAHVVRSPDARQARPGEAPFDVAVAAARELEACLEQNHHKIAALIVEPMVQCASGFAMHDAEYLRRARSLCDRYQLHLICDEIAVGYGRTGRFFAHEHTSIDGQSPICPDFICLSKGITGGTLPLSVVLSRPPIFEAFYDDSVSRAFLHSHSYTGNPLACAAALATLDLFEQESVLDANRRRADLLSAALAELAASPGIRHFRHLGMIWAFDVEAVAADFPARCFAAGLENEILLRPIGSTVYLMPPYLLDETSALFLAERVERSVATARR